MDTTMKLSIEESAHEHEMEIQDENGQRLGTVWLESPDTATGEEMAFGVELVRRWNHFPALVEALEGLVQTIEFQAEANFLNEDAEDGEENALTRAREALKAASE